MLPLTPMLLEGAVFTITEAALAAVAVGVLGAFGAYKASVSGKRWYVSAARMAAAGVVVGVLNLLLP